ncbi:SusC/RagA family TonB-linked outer membrane protein [Flavobacterium sp. SORGH_AS_0622]|uniref:SusC/RagA family TonB-linked outer membrane protein n=1 Tax=Flavobacterium sp. SORGH_AS_0622 TaxID=3041772 RepID=UPI00277DA29A|nr:SusC/RagA family TonB-linked outer membrane protein [Flavobacterium sp. SORGH_AS_0622]MDQ1164658.1 TonB-linked SusC/RagA family outer membrane protein [Flavobacterium sp. SORGH_AS_0622]
MNYFSFYKDGKALYCLIFTAILFTFSSSFAVNSSRHFTLICQQHRVQGIVTDGNFPLPGVTIVVKGNKNGAITDYNGQFNISASPDDTLFVSLIGFKTKVVPVNNRVEINIKLEYDTTTLQEVRVNAGYYSVKERDRTGSIARITSKDIETQPVANVLGTMQGRMAGVNITQNTGMPGGGFSIQIRGQNSLRYDGNDPLYIIDGVPYSSQSVGSGYTSTNMPSQNSPLNSINPSDIESIEVLKDADATSIYGSRGANGVVLITTKKGKSGRTSFSAQYDYGLGRVTRYKDVLSTPDYLAMRREAFANDYVTSYPAWAYDVNGAWDQNRDTDWQKELIGGTSEYTHIQTSLSGGSQQTRFLLGGNYHRETTVFPGSFDYVKSGGHLSLNHESQDKKFSLAFSALYSVQFSTLPSSDLSTTAAMLPPNAPALYDASGNLNWENNTFDNPLATLEGKTKGDTNDIIVNALLSYDIAAGFSIRSSFGYTNLNQQQHNLQPSTLYNPAYGLTSSFSSVFTNNINRNSWIAEPQLVWKNNFGKAALEALVGTTFQQLKGDNLVSYAMGFSNNHLLENAASASRTGVLNSDENLYRYNSIFTRINFNWEGKYIVNITGRRDGSSRFGPGRQFADFGAAGMAWVFSEEETIKEKLSFLSFGKFRASYGTSGSDQIGDYQYLDSYGSSGYNYQGISGIQPNRLFNPNFGWEVNKKLEAAIETGFFKDRLFLTAIWFRNRSSNQLIGIPLPGTTGFQSIQANLNAVVQNQGFEITLRTLNFKNSVFSWITNFNFTSARNQLISFPGLEGSTYTNQYVIGQPLNIQKVYHYTGLDPLTGVYQFEDVNGDDVLNPADDKQTIKNLNPKFYGGLQNTFQYRNLEFDFLFQFVRQENFNENSGNPMPGTMYNQPSGVLSHWENPGDAGPYQGYSDSNGNRSVANSRLLQSDAAISDASFVRLKNISLSYSLPNEWTKKLTCRLSLQGQNVLTFTKYKGIDPEFKNTGYLPPLRIYTTSIQITF